MKNKKFKSAIRVKDGVKQPSSLNRDAIKKFKDRKKKKFSAADYIEGIQKGSRTIISQAITLIESSLPEHYHIAREIIEKCLPFSGNSIRIGITGVPGVGKSTFIETFGLHITGKSKKLAVLAIDPSSEQSKGSILGDKTRMEELSKDPNAFIRPSPAAGSLGGVARKTRETIILCEAAGFDTIFIETVGVGQSETAVHSMVDFFLLLMLAGAGDELQGIKRGIMEMADTVVITKADGTNMKKAEIAKIEYENALYLFPLPESKWSPKVLSCSALNKKGIDKVWDTIEEYYDLTKKNSFFYLKRREQAKYWMYESINENLKNQFYNHPIIKEKLKLFEQDVLHDKISSFNAAKMLLNDYFGNEL